MQLHVSTRKGLFIYALQDGEWKVESRHFLGNPVSMSLFDPRDQTLYAALNLGHFGVKLHRSRDLGKNWEAVAVPVYPEKPASDKDDNNSWSLEQIWCLENGAKTGELWAGTIPGGLFHSKDHGDSWQLNESLWYSEARKRWFGGGYNQPGIHSIFLHPKNPKHIVLAVSCGGVWQSRDNGLNWECTAKGMVADYMPDELKKDPNIQDPHRLAVCPSQPQKMWVQHHNGIFHSEDGGHNWKRIKAEPSHFGFAVVVDPHDGNCAWFVPGVKDECRIPVNARLIVNKTNDAGHHFEALDNGLPERDAYDLVYRHGLTISDDGNYLAMGSTTGNLWVSSDQGEYWELQSVHLPPIYALRFA